MKYIDGPCVREVDAYLTGLKRWMQSYSLIISAEAIFPLQFVVFPAAFTVTQEEAVVLFLWCVYVLEVGGRERFTALKSNFLLLYGCCQKIWLASVFCNLQTFQPGLMEKQASCEEECEKLGYCKVVFTDR